MSGAEEGERARRAGGGAVPLGDHTTGATSEAPTIVEILATCPAARIVGRLHRAAAAVAEAGDPEMGDALMLMASNGIRLETTLRLAPGWHAALRRRERDAAILAAARRHPELHGRTLARAVAREIDAGIGPERVHQLLREWKGNRGACDYHAPSEKTGQEEVA